jgi:hypothetical protein
MRLYASQDEGYCAAGDVSCLTSQAPGAIATGHMTAEEVIIPV